MGFWSGRKTAHDLAQVAAQLMIRTERIEGPNVEGIKLLADYRDGRVRDFEAAIGAVLLPEVPKVKDGDWKLDPALRVAGTEAA